MSIEPEKSFGKIVLNDKDIATCLSLSVAWVRGQRHKRRKGEAHTLDIDPIYIGTCPRYLRTDVEDFVARMVEQRS